MKESTELWGTNGKIDWGWNKFDFEVAVSQCPECAVKLKKQVSQGEISASARSENHMHGEP